MDTRYINVIKKAFGKLNKKVAKFGISGLSEDELSPEPRFYSKASSNGIECYQHQYLGFYVLRTAYRGILLGVNYLVAGDKSLDYKLYGLAINSYYTAAYHILACFLALNRRLIFDNQLIWKDENYIMKINLL